MYLTIQDFYNGKWAEQKLRGFAEAHEAFQSMFEEHYNQLNNVQNKGIFPFHTGDSIFSFLCGGNRFSIYSKPISEIP